MEAYCEQHYNNYFNITKTTQDKQHVSKLPVWCHPCVHKTQQINVSWNGTINNLFLAKISTAAFKPGTLNSNFHLQSNIVCNKIWLPALIVAKWVFSGIKFPVD